VDKVVSLSPWSGGLTPHAFWTSFCGAVVVGSEVCLELGINAASLGIPMVRDFGLFCCAGGGELTSTDSWLSSSADVALSSAVSVFPQSIDCPHGFAGGASVETSFSSTFCETKGAISAGAGRIAPPPN